MDVLCSARCRADVIETKGLCEGPDCRSATQSGAGCLVIDGKLHPRFMEDADVRRYIVNGVGTSAIWQTSGLCHVLTRR